MVVEKKEQNLICCLQISCMFRLLYVLQIACILYEYQNKNVLCVNLFISLIHNKALGWQRGIQLNIKQR